MDPNNPRTIGSTPGSGSRRSDCCRLHTTDSTTDSSRLFTLHQMASLINMSAPLNQGSSGTCVGYAFAKTLVDGVLGKYAVPLNIGDVVSHIKVAIPCWEGEDLESMCKQWNRKPSKMWFEDSDRKCRYQVGVRYKRLNTIEEAYAYIKKISGV